MNYLGHNRLGTTKYKIQNGCDCTVLGGNKEEFYLTHFGGLKMNFSVKWCFFDFPNLYYINTLKNMHQNALDLPQKHSISMESSLISYKQQQKLALCVINSQIQSKEVTNSQRMVDVNAQFHQSRKTPNDQ